MAEYKRTSGRLPQNAAPFQANPPPSPPKRRRRRLRRSIRRTAVLFVAAGMLLSLAWLITGAIQRSGEEQITVTETPPKPPPATEPSAPMASLPTVPVTDVGAWNFVGPVEQAPETMQLTMPDRRMIALPENGRIDMQYFNNAVFIGDSLTHGLQLYGGIDNARYCAYTGVSPRAIYSGQVLTRAMDKEQEVPMDALLSYQPDNVYVLLGVNMVGAPNETLLAYYSEMLDVMREKLGPEVGIYVQSITPVIQGTPRFSAENIAYLNDELAKMAWEKGMYFLDLHEVLAGDDGWMRPEYGSADGYHMVTIGYKAWVEYLVTHTAYNPRHAQLYLEDSAYEPPNP